MDNFLETYNPANAANLTEEQVSAMKNLSAEQIDELAAAYPNQPTGNAYLKYYNLDEKLEEQRYPLGTWKNLSNLRKLGKNELLPFGFVKSVNPVKATTSGTTVTPGRIVDLSDIETTGAEGLKKVENVIPEKEVGLSEPLISTVASPLLNTYLEAKAELDQAVEDKAHHMTIKSLEAKVAAAKEAAEIK